MKASSKRILSVLISIFLIIGTLAGYSYLIQPAYEKILNQRSEIEFRFKTIQDYEDSIAKIKNLLEEYENADEFRKAIASILPTEQKIADFIHQINTLGYFNNLKVERISIQELAVKPPSNPLAKGVGVVRSTVQLSGRYGDLKSFLGNLENNLTLMDLVDLRITPAATGDFRLQDFFTYMIMVDTYYQVK